MQLCFRAAGFVALAAVANPALAAPGWIVQPIQVGEQTVRYDQGVPTVDLELRDGVVQITPLDFDHGSPSFGIAVYNDTWKPANFDVANIRVAYNGVPVRVFTQQDLAKKAKSRAFWTSVAIAAVSGVAAGIAASQTTTYRSRTVTPGGRVYRSSYRAPSFAGQMQAAGIQAGGQVSVARVQGQLDRTLADLRDEIVQLTTVDPGESYAGRIVIDRIAPTAFPGRIDVSLVWNGETYSFAFQTAKPGTPAPVFAAVDRKSDLTSFHGGISPAVLAAAAAARPATELPARGQAVYAPPARAVEQVPAMSGGLVSAVPTRGGLVPAASAPATPVSSPAGAWGLVPVSR